MTKDIQSDSNRLLAHLKQTFPGNYQLKKHGKSFHFAQRFIPKSTTSAIQSLYEVCRLIDNIADCEHTDHTHTLKKLDQVKDCIRAHDHNGLTAITDNHQVKTTSLYLLLTGARRDVSMTQIATMDQLVEYCYQVAGTVGLMMCDLMGIQSTQARLHAIDLGIAMQLTNIARDVWQDSLLERIYLPAEHIGICQAMELRTAEKGQNARIEKSILELLHQANIFYKSGFNGLEFIPSQHRFAIYVAGKLYQRIGHQIKQRKPHCHPQKAYVSFAHKCVLATQCAARYWGAPSQPEAVTQPHDSDLFRNLGFFEGAL
ncbi:MAG: hypothetical protein CMF43_02095 [Legionellales bacterium]|nr:hypothetical protein [Legionellales bacterium]|tara:strand:- start:327 stop:1271 length:945 start_codon:yes stop_codon:yes gene_type:complete